MSLYSNYFDRDQFKGLIVEVGLMNKWLGHWIGVPYLKPLGSYVVLSAFHLAEVYEIGTLKVVKS